MTRNVTLWRIAQEAQTYFAEDMTGDGGLYADGRWHGKGRRVVYSASSIALSCIETVVHINQASFPFNRYLVQIKVPEPVYDQAEILTDKTAPVGWDAVPAGLTSIKFGNEWLSSRKSLLLIVPSVIIPEEFNVLINPGHEDISKITVKKIRKWIYDPRMTGLALK